MTAMQQIAPAFDPAEAKAFALRMVGAYSGGALTLMTAIGHRLGLFDALAATERTTSEELAARTGLTERYLREWLAVLTTTSVTEYDPANRTFRLPPAHAAVLTRAAGPLNVSATSQFVTVAAAVEDEMVVRFRDGAGTHYHDYDRFHEVMAESNYRTVLLALEPHILPLVPDLKERLEAGIAVADLGCGAGRALLHMAERFPRSTFTGFDLCADAFAASAAEADEKGLTNVFWRQADLSHAREIGRYDFVVAFDAVHDQADPLAVLQTARAALADGGLFLMQEIGGSGQLEEDVANPFAPLLYMMSVMHCTPISIGQGGPALGTMWGAPMAEEYLRRAGFTDVMAARLPHDPINVYFTARA